MGIDSLNSYYDPALKRARLEQLAAHPGFRFVAGDINDPDALGAAADEAGLTTVVHLAAQAGVRYSIDNPVAYAEANLLGHLAILELCRQRAEIAHLVYASSSSVYGKSTPAPFRETARADEPASLYAATKRADELMSYTYSDLYGLRQTGLRFFTVYGPWGRPDMAYWRFTEAILAGRPIQVFNHGDLKRDFSYIDDVVAGVLGVVDHPPEDGKARHRLYNIGANRPEHLGEFIATIERAVGREAEKQMLPMQPGDVFETYADTSALEALCGFRSATPISEGIPRFVAWFRAYHGL